MTLLFSLRATIAASALGLAVASPAVADKIRNPTAVFSGLDKITGRIVSFEVGVDETVQFGALQLTPRVCYSRPSTETPNTTAFIEVDEVTVGNEYRRIFTGWTFASSPGLHGIEHPVYDIWLTECKGGTEVIPEPKEASAPAEPQVKPVEKPKRPPQPRAGAVDGSRGSDLAPPPGVPAQPRQPTQRYYPTNQGAPAPAGSDLRPPAPVPLRPDATR
ncbi:DUF2155 domain-containing protein [Chelatococcus sp. SYSU_G07232]|uniref:DUF2155 domain-containing protein n=1 Tax=Chelatococcus albus TaxID=3047466 RepID=A0ABT7ABK1_9HYPH|nr:DUF2155 domain-containing protein [Chelatococcus sp. SYSU_G07232]MDJ1156698.1 DUF2155 domain-containing protein [Chelatococcus sp. SYSU_G07232]